MPATTITSKGQVTIPKPIRQAMGVGPGDRVRFMRDEDGVVTVEPETIDLRTLNGMFRGRVSRCVTFEEMDAGIAGAVAESLKR